MAQMENYTPKINARNQAFAQRIRDHAQKYSIVGIVDVTGLPAPQFQRIRASLHKMGAEVLIVKRNLIELVLTDLEKTHSGISDLASKAQGVIGLVFTNDNPFTMFKSVQKNKSSAPAKAGAVAPNDIIVPAGPTSFSPGPIIGELGGLKIKAGINAGKVEIKEDSLVAKEGEVISEQLAGVLTRLGIEPMEVGLNIKAMYEAGTLYSRDVLDVDEEAILEDLKREASRAATLAYGLEWYTKDNAQLFVGEAGQKAIALALGIEFPIPETIKQLVSKANAQGTNVALSLPEEVRPAGVAAIAAAPVAEASAPANEASTAKEETKEEPAEVDAAAGLGGLF